MKSKSLQTPSRSRLAVVRWTDLPPELLPDIAGNLQNPIDIVRFRSVCRSWRFSASPPPPNKISLLFPRKVSFCIKPHHNCKSLTKYIFADAVYLLRPHRNPSQSWIVSVQESKAGKLFLRHPLTYKRISSSGKFIDLSELGVNRIAMSCRLVFDESKQMCSQCVNFSHTTKAFFFSNSNDSDAMAVYGYVNYWKTYMRLCAVRLGLSDQTSATQYVDGVIITDFVKFNERIYVVDTQGHVYVFDSTNMKLRQILDCTRFPYAVRADRSWKRFVVSEGDLYIVMELCLKYCSWPECRVFKLVTDGTSYKLRKVLNLGGRVFFINNYCSFSVPARDLPRPLKGNCVIFNSNEARACSCLLGSQKSDIYHLGLETQELGLMSSDYVDSALFIPPFVVD